MKIIVALATVILPCAAQSPPVAPPAEQRPRDKPTQERMVSSQRPLTADPAAPESPVYRESEFLDSPQVRVDVLMVSLTEAKALSLLPELRDPQKIEAAQAKLIEMIGRKEAKLVDWPEVTTHSGHRAVSETILEQKYPIEFDQPTEPQTLGGISNKKKSPAEKALSILRAGGFAIPTTFEVKNVGTTIEVEPVVSADRRAVTLQLAPQAVLFLRMQEFEVAKDTKGGPVPIKQPIFTTRKTTTAMTLRDGERRLIYVAKPAEPEDRVDLFILGVKILPPIEAK